MKTSKTKIRPQNKQLPKIEKPFFGHSQGNDFFSVVRAPSTPFFQPQVVSPFALQAKSTTSETEAISQTALQRMPAFESELIAKSELQRSPELGHRSLPYQAKLTIGQPNDQYEQEADRVASKVVQQINDPASTQSPQRQSIQRQKTAEEELQTQPKITSLQRQEEKSEELQSKSIIQSQKAIAGGEATGSLESAIADSRGSGQPLAPRLQAQIGQVMGADFSGVRVYTNSQSDRLNQSIQAKAFTTGQDLFFRQGEYLPGSRRGQELIAHELTHVVQQGSTNLTRQPQDISITNKPFLQRKFIGEMGTQLKDLNLIPLGLGNSLFAQFRKKLSDSDEIVTISDGHTSYDPETKTIYFPQSFLKDIEDLKSKKIKGDGLDENDNALLTDRIAAITHELSHANDHVINNKDVTSRTGVMKTELKAWAFEAVETYSMWIKAGKSFQVSDNRKHLCQGWLNINPNKLEDTYDSRDNNELTSRFWRYLSRACDSDSKVVLQAVAKQEWLQNEVSKYKKFVEKYVHNDL